MTKCSVLSISKFPKQGLTSPCSSKSPRQTDLNFEATVEGWDDLPWISGDLRDLDIDLSTYRLPGHWVCLRPTLCPALPGSCCSTVRGGAVHAMSCHELRVPEAWYGTKCYEMLLFLGSF